jgi:hypothetical protein
LSGDRSTSAVSFFFFSSAALPIIFLLSYHLSSAFWKDDIGFLSFLLFMLQSCLDGDLPPLFSAFDTLTCLPSFMVSLFCVIPHFLFCWLLKFG